MSNRMSPPQARVAHSDIGGAIVRRLIMRGDQVWKRPNETMTADEVQSIGAANLSAMRDAGYLQIYPVAPRSGDQPAHQLVPIETKRFAIHRGCGKYDVIEGVLVNDEQLSKEEAEALCSANAPTQN